MPATLPDEIIEKIMDQVDQERLRQEVLCVECPREPPTIRFDMVPFPGRRAGPRAYDALVAEEWLSGVSSLDDWWADRTGCDWFIDGAGCLYLWGLGLNSYGEEVYFPVEIGRPCRSMWIPSIRRLAKRFAHRGRCLTFNYRFDIGAVVSDTRGIVTRLRAGPDGVWVHDLLGLAQLPALPLGSLVGLERRRRRRRRGPPLASPPAGGSASGSPPMVE